MVTVHAARAYSAAAAAAAYFQDNWDAAVDLFNQLKSNQLGVRPNSVTYNILMSACLARDKPQTVSQGSIPTALLHLQRCIHKLPMRHSICKHEDIPLLRGRLESVNQQSPHKC